MSIMWKKMATSNHPAAATPALRRCRRLLALPIAAVIVVLLTKPLAWLLLDSANMLRADTIAITSTASLSARAVSSTPEDERRYLPALATNAVAALGPAAPRSDAACDPPTTFVYIGPHTDVFPLHRLDHCDLRVLYIEPLTYWVNSPLISAFRRKHEKIGDMHDGLVQEEFDKFFECKKGRGPCARPVEIQDLQSYATTMRGRISNIARSRCTATDGMPSALANFRWLDSAPTITFPQGDNAAPPSIHFAFKSGGRTRELVVLVQGANKVRWLSALKGSDGRVWPASVIVRIGVHEESFAEGVFTICGKTEFGTPLATPVLQVIGTTISREERERRVIGQEVAGALSWLHGRCGARVATNGTRNVRYTCDGTPNVDEIGTVIHTNERENEFQITYFSTGQLASNLVGGDRIKIRMKQLLSPFSFKKWVKSGAAGPASKLRGHHVRVQRDIKFVDSPRG